MTSLAEIPEAWAQPPAEMIGQLPKGGAKLDYVGHASVTKILLDIDPEWKLEPVLDERGIPIIEENEKGEWVMWGHLTVLGHTRMGAGTVSKGAFEREKQLISDLLRNTAMRFGIALALWSKEDWSHEESTETPPNAVPAASGHRESRSSQGGGSTQQGATERVCALCEKPIEAGEAMSKKRGKYQHTRCSVDEARTEAAAAEAVQDAFPGAERVPDEDPDTSPF